MTYRTERKRMKVRTGRVHAVSRSYPGKAGTTVKFVCGEITGFGLLHRYITEEELLTQEQVSCGRCAYSLEQSAAREAVRKHKGLQQRAAARRAARAT